MAGIIAAAANGIGVMGVAWNTHVEPLRIFTNKKSTDVQASHAIEFALAHQASVINASWVSPCPLQHVREQLDRALEEQVLIVTAAGNAGSAGPGVHNIDEPDHAMYPANYKLSNVIVVMSHGHDGEPSAGSNWGPRTVDLAAPGWAYTTTLCTEQKTCYNAVPESTSNATAYVSGAAALLKSVHPNWTAQWLKTHLIESAVPDPALKGKVSSGARLSLDRALLGPLSVVAPARGARWSRSSKHTVIRLRCLPGDFVSVSEEFSIRP